LSDRYAALGVPVSYLGLRGFFGPSMLVGGWRFMRLLRQKRVSIVHAHDIYSNIFVTAWARLAAVPVVIVSQRWGRKLPNKRLTAGNRIAFTRATAILANSEQVANVVIQDHSVPAAKVRTITNFADDSAFARPSLDVDLEWRRRWRIPEHAVVIGCVARLSPVKNQESLIRALAALRDRDARPFLVLVGDGETRAALQRLSRELGVSEAVCFTGELRDGANHHRGFDISVLVSVSEGFPNTLVEAMAAGRPVVATDVGGNRDAVMEGETGFLVPAGDIDQLTSRLSQLVDDAELRRQLGHAGMRRASNLYRASRVIAQLTSMYDELLSGTGQ
jgi:glycosyltransferase involved in cell wall biosynthesis